MGREEKLYSAPGKSPSRSFPLKNYKGKLTGHQLLPSSTGQFPIVQSWGDKVHVSCLGSHRSGWLCCQRWRGWVRAHLGFVEEGCGAPGWHLGCWKVCVVTGRLLHSGPCLSGHFLRKVPAGPDGRCVRHEIPLSACVKPRASKVTG